MDRTRPLVIALLVGAALNALFAAMNHGTILVGPYADLGLDDVTAAIRGATPFLLPAAVLAGMDCWPGGRRRLLQGVLALGVAAILDLVLQIGLVDLRASGYMQDDAARFLVVVRAVAQAAAAAIGLVLLAAGLLADRGTAPVGGRRFGAMMLLGGLVAMAAAEGALLPLLVVPASSPDRGLQNILSVADALATLATGVLGIAAVRRVESARELPEGLIAVGVVLVVLALVWRQTPIFVMGPQAYATLEGGFFVPANVASVLGPLVIAGGFALGALFTAREVTRTRPLPRPAGHEVRSDT